MADYVIKGQTLTDIADAIRSKTGGSSPIDVSDFATEIENIPSGSNATLVSAQSVNRGSGTALTYTFTTGGKYQFITMATGDTAPSLSDFTITLNSTPVTPTYSLIANVAFQYPYAFFFDEITVSANDVLTVQVSSASNRGAQLLIFKDGSLSNFNLIGFVENNDNYTFALNPNCRYFQVYNCKYYSSSNDFAYEWATNVSSSRATPSSYWYGFTYVLTV